jgi:O-antigen ligase
MTATLSPERVPVFERLRAALLGANLAWTVLCLGGALASTGAVTAVLTSALVLAHLLDPARPARPHPAPLLFAPFLLYAAANAARVSPVRWLGWSDWFNWAQAAAVFWVVLDGIRSGRSRRALCLVIAAVALVSSAMAVYQHFGDPGWLMLGRRQLPQYIGRSSGSFGNPNGFGAYTVLLIPPLVCAASGRGRTSFEAAAAWVVLAAVAAGFVLAISRGAWVALAAAAAIGPLVAGDLAIGRRWARAATGLLAAAAAAALLYATFPEMRGRLHQFAADLGEKSRPIVWAGAWRIFEAHPVLGSGAGSFGVLFEDQRPTGFIVDPVYAHCDYLNTLSDYGAVGFVLLFVPAAVLAWKGRRARGLAGAAWVGLLAFGLHDLVDFNLKYPALAMLAAAIAALVTADVWPAPVGEAPPKPSVFRFGALAGTAAVLLITGAFVPKFRAESFRLAARRVIDRLGDAGGKAVVDAGVMGPVRTNLDRAVALDPGNAQAWSDRAYADSLWAFVAPSEARSLGVAAERDAERAIGLSPVVAEFWIRRGTGLDMQGKWVEGGDCFARALVMAPNRPETWYYQAFHLSLAPNETGPAIVATDYCLRLDPGFLLAQVLRERLGRRTQ